MRRCIACLLLFVIQEVVMGQPLREQIRSQAPTVIGRQQFKKNLLNRTVRETFSQPLDSSSEYRYASAFGAVAQFFIIDSLVDKGFRQTLQQYRSLDYGTRRAFLEALLAVDTGRFRTQWDSILLWEPHPKAFAMAAVYADRFAVTSRANLLACLNSQFPQYPTHPVLTALEEQLTATTTPRPAVSALFAHQSVLGIKTVYSFQRRNRDYPGIVVVQQENGRFVRDSSGHPTTLRQLARSASNMPYFLTNGNTPQGVYSIQGIGKSQNHFIGPTPNLQLTLPFEAYWADYFVFPADSTDPTTAYASLFPESWQHYRPIWEAFTAGKAGRTEIISHGTTIDPEYFRAFPFYPISPTLGCLCLKENWDPQTGLLIDSDQRRLIEAYLQTPSVKGYLFVIELDDRQEPVQPAEIELLIALFEKTL